MTPNIRRDIIYKKGGVNYMTKEIERFTLRLPKGLKSKLEARSREMGVSLNSLVIQFLWDGIEYQSDSHNGPKG